jgi:hypothetical protein
MARNRSENTPGPQVFVSKHKVVTINQCGPIQNRVKTTTYIKTSG